MSGFIDMVNPWPLTDLNPELRLFSPIFRDRTRAGTRQRRKGKIAGI